PPPTGSMAPNFKLTDQFGKPQELSTFRGKVVLLTFVDSHCTTICPLTAELMRQAQASLGPSAGSVQLMAVNVNADFASVASVLRWSQQHGMTRHWLFLTGTPSQLQRVWGEYGISVKMAKGDVE